MIGRRDLFPARRDTAEAARRSDTTPATPTAGGQPATTQPDTGQTAHPGWHLPDLARYWVRELLPPVMLLFCSYRVNEWLAVVLAAAWWHFARHIRARRTFGAPSSAVVRRQR